MTRAGLATTLATITMACMARERVVDREYVWTRQEPAVARKSPTVFVVRLRLDRSSKTVVWAEDVHDSEGDLGRNMKTWSGCVFLDDNNWECEPVSIDGRIVERIEMRDGQLRQQYWTEDRLFKARRRPEPRDP